MKKILLSLMIVVSLVGVAFALTMETGIVKASRDFVTVVARGEGTNRQEALEQAWTDAVRIAVGMVLSSKSNLDNDELSENIITHSRGVIEDFDILQEDKNGSRITVYIQARVHREILRDEANKYSEAQVVKADTGRAVKAQMDDTAKDTTKSNKTATGVALLKEVFDSYGPEDFFSATLDPKIHYDKKTKKPYIQINEKFNQDLFWKEFLPRVRQALEGIALKKEKKFYSKEVRQANQQLPKVGYALDLSGLLTQYDNEGRGYQKKPYYLEINLGEMTTNINGDDWQVLQAVVPDDNASYTAYYLPVFYKNEESLGFGAVESRYIQALREGIKGRGEYAGLYSVSPIKDSEDIFDIWLNFVDKMSAHVTFSITYLDQDGETISVQPIGTGPRCFNVYRNFIGAPYEYFDLTKGFRLKNAMILAPGYIKIALMEKETRIGGTIKGNVNNLFLGTANYNQKYGGGYEVELDANELQQLDSMKFEIIYN